MGCEIGKLGQKAPLSDCLDVDRPTIWDSDYREPINYDLLSAACQDEHSNTIVVRKDQFIDEEEPAEHTIFHNSELLEATRHIV